MGGSCDTVLHQRYLPAFSGRKKPLFHNEFLELLPGLAKEIFLEDSSPRKSLEYELEEERAMKNLLALFEKLYLHITDEELYRRGIKSEEIEEETKEFLLKLRDSLMRLYKVRVVIDRCTSSMRST